MSESRKTRVISTIGADSFIGRSSELEMISRHAAQELSGPLLLLSKPASGSTELLKQTYDMVFAQRSEAVPFFFEFRPGDRTVRQAAIRFLQTFVVQLTAFRRNDTSLSSVTPDVCELNDLSLPSDIGWIGKLIDSCNRVSELNDESSFVRHALSAPLRASAENTDVFPMIAGLEHTAGLEGDADIFELIKETFAAFQRPFLFEGKRRFISNAVKKGATRFGEFAHLEVRNLSLKDSSLLCETLSGETGVETSAQTRDLIGLQFEGSPVLIASIFQSAKQNGENLDSFKHVQKAYVRELFEGRLRGYFDSFFDTLSVDTEVQRKVVDLIYGSKEFSKEPAPAESWNENLGLKDREFRNILQALNSYEFIDLSSNLIGKNNTSVAFGDYLSMRFRLELERVARPVAYGSALTGALKRAPEVMSEYYRRSSAIGLKELLAVFDCQEIPVSLLFYNVFKELHKGKPDDQMFADIGSETDRLTLPQIVFTVNSVSVYGQLSKFTEKERSAVALGFESGDYSEESETVWIAAEIDSKLEAGVDVTEFWCDRLEMIALMRDYKSYRIWLIAPEGFSPEAVAVLNSRNAIGSSRKQVELLIKQLDVEKLLGSVKPDNAFEMVVPMGEDTELIAAHAVEEIARRHSFGVKEINQIKTALVEACINATEHSKSPDRKIYQRFEMDGDKIVITISNRGLRFKGKETKEITPTDGRRGWGLKLMKTLMDDVRFEQVDDGTRIKMTKQITTKA